MKEYEMILEIINQCPMNHDRDTIFEEIMTDDPEAYLRRRFLGQEITLDKTVQKDGSIVFDIMAAGQHQRCTFTEI